MAENNVNIEKETNKDSIPEFKGIFKFGIAKSLLEDYGHRLVGMKMNRDKSGKVVYFFENSLQLHYDMQKIVKERRKRFAEMNKENEVEKPQQED